MRIRFIPKFIAFALVAVVGATHAVPDAASSDSSAGTGWIVTPESAAERVADSDVTILDARSREAWRREHVVGAAHFDWTAFTPDAPSKRGRLLADDEALRAEIRKLGVSNDRRVFVVGAGDGGWGEAGRAVWMLRTLGHRAAAWVDGGHEALVSAGVETTDSSPKVESGDFDVDRREDWAIDRAQLRKEHRSDDIVVLDTRQRREFEGATPFGESRGGHIPGARHLHFRELLGDNGRLLPESKLRAKLRERGVVPDKTVVTYCTGGVRSAWVASVLIELGYPDVRNYAGSTWEWSASPASKYPLETK